WPLRYGRGRGGSTGAEIRGLPPLSLQHRQHRLALQDAFVPRRPARKAAHVHADPPAPAKENQAVAVRGTELLPDKPGFAGKLLDLSELRLEVLASALFQ